MTKLLQTTLLRAAFSLLFLVSTVHDVRRKLHMAKIHWTVRKQAKRMPDATVESTCVDSLPCRDLNPGPSECQADDFPMSQHACIFT